MQNPLATPLLTIAVCCLPGCGGTTPTQYEMVAELIATKDLPASSIIDKPEVVFHAGKLFYKGEPPKTGPKFEPLPADIFPGTWMGVIGGKKVVRELKKDEVVKMGDIVEPDGSPFHQPPK